MSAYQEIYRIDTIESDFDNNVKEETVSAVSSENDDIFDRNSILERFESSFECNGLPARLDCCLKIVEMLNSGEFDSKEEEDWAAVNALPRVQIRSQDYITNMRDIAEKINEAGSIKNTDPVTIFEGLATEADYNLGHYIDCLVDGNHTIGGIGQSDYNTVKTRRIPREVWMSLGLTLNEMKYVGRFLNDQEKVVKAPNCIDTHIKALIENKEKHGLNFDDPFNIEYLKSSNISSSRRKSIIEKAFNEYQANQDAVAGKKVMQYGKLGTPENNDLLFKTMESLRTETTMVTSGSSGATKNLTQSIVDQVLLDTNDEKTELVLCLYHNNHRNKKQWEDFQGNPFIKNIKKLIGDRFKNPIDFQVYVMPFYEKDFVNNG